MEALANSCIAAVALVYFVAAATKLLQPDSAASALAMLSERLRSRAIVAGLAMVEVAVGAFLLVSGGALSITIAATTLIAFTAFLVYLATRESPTPCGCIGDAVGTDSNHWGGIGRNAALLAGLAGGAVWGGPPQSVALVTGAELALALLVTSESLPTLVMLRERRQ